ncbi:MAG: ATP-binding protein [Chloroflexota bacterium]
MLSSLRNRLLLSYFAIIGVTLLVVAAALFGFATVSGVRLIPSLQRLAAISRTNQNELLQLWVSGGSSADLQGLLIDTANQTDTRILVVDTGAEEIVLDTAEGDDWVGDQFSEVERPPGVVLPNIGRGSLFGRYIAPDGSAWLVFAEPNPELGRALIFYSEPEPTARAYFSEYFMRPLVIAGILALLLSVLLALIITRSVTGPLRKMASAARGIALGDYEQRVPPEGPEEVRRVAESFNSMAMRVQTTQQSQRDFVANVSHDLKTPITAIQGWSQALLDGAATEPEEQTRAATTIHSEAGRMDRMVSELLDLARLESGQIVLAHEPVDLGGLLAEVQHTFEPQAEAGGITLSLAIQPVPPVLGDADRLTQIFSNLVDNALTYTPPGGSVTLTAHPVGTDWVEASVRDTGPGIPPAEQERIFERFYRVDKSRTRADKRGSGLGLAIVQELVTAIGGEVRLESQPGEGTAFIIRLKAINGMAEGD